MMRRARAWLGRLRRRRRRFWRYVSPRRRGAGLVLLAWMVGLVYFYWYLTNDRRIRHEAVQYLRNLTGAIVSIQDARFSLFRGIELRGVKVEVPQQESREPLFWAQTVTLKHEPWALLVKGQVRPTNITCFESRVTDEYDTQTGQSNLQRALEARDRQGPHRGGGSSQLVPIHLPGLTVRCVEIGPDAGEPYEERLTVTAIPQGDTYLVVFEGEQEAGGSFIQGSLVLDGRGQVSKITGTMPTERLRKALPAKYRRWLERYGIAGGNLVVSRDPSSLPAGGEVRVQLVDLKMKLPKAQGGLDLTDVNADVVFYRDRVELKAVSGRVDQAGGAGFEMTGEYEGYEADSPFRVKLSAWAMTVPKQVGAEQELAGVLTELNRMLQPQRPLDLKLEVWREKGGEPTFRGTIEPKGMSLRLKYFPYRLDDVTGRVDFTAQHVRIHQLRGRHGAGRFTIRGDAELKDDSELDIYIEAADCRFDDELKAALPQRFTRVWEALHPAGIASGTVHVRREQAGGPQRIDVVLRLDGRGSAGYEGFPYRLKNLKGEIRFEGDRAFVNQVLSRDGDAVCKIDGQITDLDANKPSVNLTIEAKNVPIDEKLRSALPRRGREALDAIKPSGTIKDLAGTITYSSAADLDYDLDLSVSGGGLQFTAFPYPLANVAGTLTIRPERLILKKLTGRHKKTNVTVSGQAWLGGETFGLDLSVGAEDVPLDEELFEALPEEVQEAWRDLSPAGLADITVLYQENTPERPDKQHYHLKLNAKNMQIKYKYFPYPLRGIRGEVTATPGRIVLGREGPDGKREDMTAAWDRTRAQLNGEILTDPTGDQISLQVRAKNVPLDKQLLAAMPRELAPLTEQIEPKGTCDFDLDEFRIHRTPTAVASQPATQAAVRAASAPATQPAWPRFTTSWNLAGNIAFKDATVRLGLDPKTLTGTIAGRAKQLGEAVTLDANIALDSLTVNKRKLTDLRGRLVKGEDAVLHIQDLTAKGHGGKVAGSGAIRLTQPLTYGVSLFFEGVDVGNLFNAGVADPNRRLQIEGLMEGEIRLEHTPGDPAGTLALGGLEITRGRLSKLPIMLDLLHLITLSPPVKSACTEAYLKYELRGHVLIFREIYLKAPGLDLVGSGTANLKTKELKLRFLNGPRLPRMSSLDELLEGIALNIMGIEVAGTLSDPQTRSVPVSSLEAAVRKLYNPAETGK